MSILEALCRGCGEIFNPIDETDTLHGLRSDGEVCGAEGEIVGEWISGFDRNKKVN